jgi:hypothetical protein
MRAPTMLAVLTTAILFSTPLLAQVWDYQSYNRAGKAFEGTLNLTEPQPGKFKVRLLFPNPDTCYRSELSAAVTNEQGQQVITIEPLMQGCPEVRFVLNTDGSGGKREERLVDGSWKWDKTERGLKKK